MSPSQEAKRPVRSRSGGRHGHQLINARAGRWHATRLNVCRRFGRPRIGFHEYRLNPRFELLKKLTPAGEIPEYPEFRRQIIPDFAQTKAWHRFRLVEFANRPVSANLLLSLLSNAAAIPFKRS